MEDLKHKVIVSEGTYTGSGSFLPEMVAWCRKRWGRVHRPGIRQGEWQLLADNGAWAFRTPAKAREFRKEWGG